MREGNVGAEWKCREQLVPHLVTSLVQPSLSKKSEDRDAHKKNLQTCIGEQNGLSESKYQIHLLPPINQSPSLEYIYARLYRIGTDQTSLMSLQGVRLLLSIPSEKATAA